MLTTPSPLHLHFYPITLKQTISLRFAPQSQRHGEPKAPRGPVEMQTLQLSPRLASFFPCFSSQHLMPSASQHPLGVGSLKHSIFGFYSHRQESLRAVSPCPWPAALPLLL